MNKLKKTHLIKLLTSEQGAVMVEFGLMLPFFVIVMLFLILVYGLVKKSINLQAEAYDDLRRKCTYVEDNFGREGPTKRVKGESQSGIVVLGAMSKILQTTYIPLNASLVSYAGSWQSNGLSRYFDLSGYRYYWAPLGGE